MNLGLLNRVDVNFEECENNKYPIKKNTNITKIDNIILNLLNLISI